MMADRRCIPTEVTITVTARGHRMSMDIRMSIWSMPVSLGFINAWHAWDGMKLEGDTCWMRV